MSNDFGCLTTSSRGSKGNIFTSMATVRILMDFVKLLLTVTRPYSDSFLDAIYRIIFGAKQVLPPIDDKILLTSATKLAQQIRKKQIKTEDIMKAYIKRIKEVDPLINACVDQRFEAALKEAKDVDLFLATSTKSEEQLEKDTPLLGVPFSCKESIGVKGLAQTCGIYAARDRKAPIDAVSTSLYRKAGAIPVVVTNIPEFCTWWDSENVPFGRTVNPYDNIRCAGGSSGGEGAILAYAGAVIGIGNDLAGSIRMPSTFNGIYGLKPSPGKISNIGFWPSEGDEGDEIDKFVGTGPMCRYAQDLPLLARVMSAERINFDKKVDFTKLKIYYMEQYPGYLYTPIPEIRAAVRKAADYFGENYGNKPTKITIPELKYALEIWESKLLEAGMPPFRDAIAGPGKHINLFTEFIKCIFGYSEHTLQAIYYATIERRAKDSNYYRYLAMYESLKKKLEESLGDEGLLLVPTHPEPAPHHLMTIPKYPNQGYTSIFNVLYFPSTQIPAGMHKGLPLGIQAVSTTNNDYITITAATELEKLFGGWRSPSKDTSS